MKYEWSLRKYWKSWFIQDVKKIWYKTVHGIELGNYKTIIPSTGNGRFYSVKRKTAIFEITEKKTGNLVRIIPYKENHGFMIENWMDGKLISRKCLGFEELWVGAEIHENA